MKDMDVMDWVASCLFQITEGRSDVLSDFAFCLQEALLVVWLARVNVTRNEDSLLPGIRQVANNSSQEAQRELKEDSVRPYIPVYSNAENVN